jgi:ATP-dependent Lon protease
LPDTPLPYRFVTNKGVERFKIVNVVQEKPVLLCEVEVLEEDEDESEDVSAPLLNR